MTRKKKAKQRNERKKKYVENNKLEQNRNRETGESLGRKMYTLQDKKKKSLLKLHITNMATVLRILLL